MQLLECRSFTRSGRVRVAHVAMKEKLLAVETEDDPGVTAPFLLPASDTLSGWRRGRGGGVWRGGIGGGSSLIKPSKPPGFELTSPSSREELGSQGVIRGHHLSLSLPPSLTLSPTALHPGT